MTIKATLKKHKKALMLGAGGALVLLLLAKRKAATASVSVDFKPKLSGARGSLGCPGCLGSLE